MTQYFLKRIIYTIPTLIGVVLLVFLIVRMVPGDPAILVLGVHASADEVQRLREAMGLTDPMHIQLLKFVRGAITGDMGLSIRSNEPVFKEVRDRMPSTLWLMFGGMSVGICLGVPLGILSAVRRDTWVDQVTRSISLLGVSIPNFFLGLGLIFLFAFKLRWFPYVGDGGKNLADTLWHLVLPSFALGLLILGIVLRLTRSAILEVLSQDFVRTARAKGLAERSVLYKHALKNALIPVVTVVGLTAGNLLGGSVVVEQVFARPGLGKLLVDAILARDYPQVQANVLVLATGFLLINLLVDMSYVFFDPRIRYD